MPQQVENTDASVLSMTTKHIMTIDVFWVSKNRVYSFVVTSSTKLIRSTNDSIRFSCRNLTCHAES